MNSALQEFRDAVVLRRSSREVFLQGTFLWAWLPWWRRIYKLWRQR
jgi:hypothetical protein